MRVVESMTKISLPKYSVRVWRDENDSFEHLPGLYTDLHSVAQANQDSPPADLAKKIAALPRVAAVEVLDWDSGGVVVYNNWP